MEKVWRELRNTTQRIYRIVMPIDYSRYPPNWKDLVKQVKKRSGDCCEECGLKNGQIVWSVSFHIRDQNGRYKLRKLWFSNENDAKREAGPAKVVTPVRVVLTTAHLDHDEENHEVTIDRLRHMCQVCHLRYDAMEKWRRALTKWRTEK